MILLSTYKIYIMSIILFIISLFIIFFIFYVVYDINNQKLFTPYNSNDNINKYEPFTSMTSETSKLSPIVFNKDVSNPESYNKLDPFGLIKSSMKCPSTSYFTLNGNICIDEYQKMLLTTRGGNSKTGTKYEKNNKNEV